MDAHRHENYDNHLDKQETDVARHVLLQRNVNMQRKYLSQDESYKFVICWYKNNKQIQIFPYDFRWPVSSSNPGWIALHLSCRFKTFE